MVRDKLTTMLDVFRRHDKTERDEALPIIYVYVTMLHMVQYVKKLGAGLNEVVSAYRSMDTGVNGRKQTYICIFVVSILYTSQSSKRCNKNKIHPTK